MNKLHYPLGLLLPALGCFLSTGNAIADDWPMFHHDLGLSGYTDSFAPDINQVLWSFQTNGAVQSSPAVVDNRVYIGSTDGNLYCLDKETGALVWSFAAGGAVQSSPAVAEGLVYFLSTNGMMYALSAADGSPSWSLPIGPGPWDWSSPAVHDGNVFVASSNGNLYSLNAQTGVVNWTTPVGGSPDSPISVINHKVYTGTHNFDNKSPTLIAVDELTGALVWAYDYYTFHKDIVGMVNSNGAAVVDGDNDGNLEVYFGVYNWGESVDDQAVCLDEVAGTELWTTNINGNSTSTPAIHGGRMFIGSDDDNLYALNAADGSVAWSFLTGGDVWSAPAVSGDGKVCFGSLDHTVYCLDEQTGGLIWSYYTGASRLISSPAIADGMLFIGNENGKVYAFGILRVTIDIKPGSYPNSINTKSNGNIPVAVLSTATFDATMVDPATVCFGDADDQSARDCTESHNKGHVEDVNNDGLKDMVLHFETQETGIQMGDTMACLNGMTTAGIVFEGCDSVRVVK